MLYDILHIRQARKDHGFEAGHPVRVVPSGSRKWLSGETSGRLAVWKGVDLTDEQVDQIRDWRLRVVRGARRGDDHRLGTTPSKYWKSSRQAAEERDEDVAAPAPKRLAKKPATPKKRTPGNGKAKAKAVKA